MSVCRALEDECQCVNAGSRSSTALDNATNNSSNVNCNVNCDKYDDDYDNNNNNDDYNDNYNGSESLTSAWSELWRDIDAIVRAAADLPSNTVHLHDTELMQFPDESVLGVAQSLIEDVYVSVSNGQNDVGTIERHQRKLVTSLMTQFDVQLDRRPCCNVRHSSSLYYSSTNASSMQFLNFRFKFRT